MKEKIEQNGYINLAHSLYTDAFFQIEISLAKMVFIILIIWVFAWTPYVIQSMWIMFFDGSNLTPEMGIAPSLCCKLSAAFNAFLYGIRYVSIKKK